MTWGERAAEQHEKDQPTICSTGALSVLVEFQRMLSTLPQETPAEHVLDDDERSGN